MPELDDDLGSTDEENVSEGVRIEAMPEGKYSVVSGKKPSSVFGFPADLLDHNSGSKTNKVLEQNSLRIQT